MSGRREGLSLFILPNKWEKLVPDAFAEREIVNLPLFQQVIHNFDS